MNKFPEVSLGQIIEDYRQAAKLEFQIKYESLRTQYGDHGTAHFQLLRARIRMGNGEPIHIGGVPSKTDFCDTHPEECDPIFAILGPIILASQDAEIIVDAEPLPPSSVAKNPAIDEILNRATF